MHKVLEGERKMSKWRIFQMEEEMCEKNFKEVPSRSYAMNNESEEKTALFTAHSWKKKLFYNSLKLIRKCLELQRFFLVFSD